MPRTKESDAEAALIWANNNFHFQMEQLAPSLNGIQINGNFTLFSKKRWVDTGFAAASDVSDSVRPHRRQPTRLPRPWDSPGKNTGVGCHFLLQCMKVKSTREVTQLGTLSRVQLSATPWTAAYQAPPSMGVSRQEHWSGVPLPSLSLPLDTPY